MNSHEVVVHVKQRQHSYVILNLLAEGIRQASEAPHVHPHVKVLALDIAGADVLWVRVAPVGFDCSIGLQRPGGIQSHTPRPSGLPSKK